MEQIVRARRAWLYFLAGFAFFLVAGYLLVLGIGLLQQATGETALPVLSALLAAGCFSYLFIPAEYRYRATEGKLEASKLLAGILISKRTVPFYNVEAVGPQPIAKGIPVTHFAPRNEQGVYLCYRTEQEGKIKALRIAPHNELYELLCSKEMPAAPQSAWEPISPFSEVKQSQPDKLLEHAQPEMLRALSELLRIPSVKETPAPDAPFGLPIRRALDTILALCKQLGLPAYDLNGYAGYAEIGRGSEMVASLVHLDVVPAADEGWRFPPFSGTMDGDVLYGRGAVDNKGPAIASLFALKAIQQSNLPLHKRIRVIFGCDEESGWGCMAHYAAHAELPAMAFSPDAQYPIINTEKGIYQAIIRFPGTAGVRLAGGTRPNVVPAEATAELSLSQGEAGVLQAMEGITLQQTPFGYKVKCTGVSAHASTPEQGANAIVRLLEDITAVVKELQNSPLRELHRLFASSLGEGVPGLAYSDRLSGALTLNLGTLIYSEEGGCAQVDIRHPVTLPAVTVRNLLQQSLPAGWILEEGHLQAPHHVDPSHPLVRTLAEVYQKYTGLEGSCVAIGGGTYARTIPVAVAFGPLFAGEDNLAHKNNECITAKSLLQNAKIYAAALHALADVPNTK